MAGPHWRASAHLNGTTTSDIAPALMAHGNRFTFFQAVRLLRHIGPGDATDAAGEGSPAIRFKGNLSLAFPPADIEMIERAEDPPGYCVTVNFMGLYGSASPLPTFYTEDLLDEASQDESVSRDFLDIFNQRLYELLFEGWHKYRQFFKIAENRDPSYLERLYCLLGLGSEPLRRDAALPGGPEQMLRYLGIFTQFPRSAAGLEAILRDALDGVPLAVEPCIPRKAEIPDAQRLCMGVAGSRLGMDTYLGKEIEDRMGKFRIRIGPLDQAGYLRFTPGKADCDKLVALTENYLAEPLAYEVELILAARQARTVALGDPVRAELGVTSWVFSKPYLGEVRTRFAVQRA